MINKFLQGLVMGTGFGIAFVAVVMVLLNFALPVLLKTKAGPSEVVGYVPSIEPAGRFLGAFGSYSVGFSERKKGVLASGPGRIVGSATVNGKPVAGLKLQLALNGSVLSQSATTDSSGQYVIDVPYGKYRIDGYDLDARTANRVLAGKIDHPQRAYSSEEFEVSKDSSGYGLNFTFIDPISTIIPKKKFSLSEDVVISWQPYPGATRYFVQVYEKTDPHEYRGTKAMFAWANRPSISGTSINLKNHNVQFKPGHFYVIEIGARDDEMGIVSQTASRHQGFDFEVIK